MDANIPIVEEEHKFPAVSPYVSGQGLPYAPVDWPNPGDIWGWRVGNRVNNSGFFTDRFLVAPKRLQPTTLSLGSRRAVTLYLQSNHPNADIDAFFSSFSWYIPAQKMQHPNKVRQTPCSSSSTSSSSSYTPNPHHRKLRKLDPEEVVVIRRSARQLAKFTKKYKYDNTVIDLCSETEGSDTSEPTKRASADFQKSSPHCVDAPCNNFVPSHSHGNLPAQEITADFQKNSPHCVDAPSNTFVASQSLGNLQAQEFREEFDNDYLNYRLTEDNVLARKKLSDILGMDLRALLSSKELITEMVFLLSKLRRDPTLIPAECSILKLIDEIPAIIKDHEEMEAGAGKSFTDLEANIALATNLKSNLHESSFIQEFDDHITALQAQRAQIRDAMEKIKKDIAQFTAKQRMVFECLPKVVDKIHLADQSEWEMKKKAAASEKADILKKFAGLIRKLVTVVSEKFR